MGRAVVQKFNRGEISTLALARDDVNKIDNTCELMDNFMPLRLGPMRFRPGLEYIGNAEDPTTDQNRALIPLTRSIGDSVMFEFSGTTMRPLVDGLPVQIGAGASGITNGDFTTDTTGWGGLVAATWNADHGGSVKIARYGYLFQVFNTSASLLNAVTIEVHDAPVLVRITGGLTFPNSDAIVDMIAYPGSQIIQFNTSDTACIVRISSIDKLLGDGYPDAYLGKFDTVATGEVSFTVPDVKYSILSYDSSADVLFLAMGEDNEPKIVRRVGANGYTFETYFQLNGPFDSMNISNTTIEGSHFFNDITYDTTSTLFTVSSLGRLLQVAYPERIIIDSFTSVVASTERVGVRGYDTDREILVTVSGGSGTVELQKKSDVGSTWETVRTYTGAGTDIILDKSDGDLYYYRFECTAYTSGTIKTSMEYVSTKAYGYGKIRKVNSAQQAEVTHLQSNMYASTETTPSLYWKWGSWYTGTYPQGVTLYEGRLVWVSKNRVDMTVTDDYYNFDRDIDGASAAISRTIGFGPVDNIAWVESCDKLYIGLPTTEVLVRSTNFDEPLTPLNTNLKPGKGQGSKAVRAVASDDYIYFVSRDGTKLNELNTLTATDKSITNDMMMLHPDICSDGIASVAISKHPEQRIWILTETGELRVLLKEPTEDAQGWSRVTVDGTIEDICIIPASGEDEVWMIVRRNGSSAIEKLSAFANIEPMDSFVRYTSPGTAVLTGLTHLEGLSVGVWADNADAGDFTVASGQITVASAAYTNVVVGLRYTADYKSNKLAQYIAESVIGERKRVTNTALVLQNYSPGALKVGRDFTHLRSLPGITDTTLVTDYDEQPFEFGGTCDTDSRICMRATGPCTILALSYNVNYERNKSDG